MQFFLYIFFIDEHVLRPEYEIRLIRALFVLCVVCAQLDFAPTLACLSKWSHKFIKVRVVFIWSRLGCELFFFFPLR